MKFKASGRLKRRAWCAAVVSSPLSSAIAQDGRQLYSVAELQALKDICPPPLRGMWNQVFLPYVRSKHKAGSAK
jgi:hypothetical protein